MQDSGKQDQMALLALFAGAAGIAFSPIFVRLADIDPIASAFYRTTLAIPVFLLLPFLFPQSKPKAADETSQRDFFGLILAGLFFAGDLAFWHYSIQLTSVANATLFPNLAPIFVTFAAWALFKERITERFLLGLVVAISGAIIVLGDSLARGGGHIRGDIFGVVTALFYAGYLLMVSRLRKTHTTLTIMTWTSVVTSLVLLPLCLWSGQNLVPAGPGKWAALFGLSWFSHMGGQGMIAYALAHLPVSFSSVGLLLQPALAALFAFLILGEPLGLWQGLGAMVILAGIYLARRGAAASS